MKKNLKEHYSYSLYADSHFADIYEKDRFGSGFGAFLKRYETELYDKLIPHFKLMLDVGAGTGKLTGHFAKRGFVVASDASLPMLIQARKLARQHNIHYEAVVCDAHHLCFRNQAFDAVVSSRVLMHVVDWKRMVAELCRVSSKDVVLDFPNYFSMSLFERVFRKLVKPLLNNIQSYRGFLGKTVAAEFGQHGFTLEIKLKSFFLPVALYRMLNSPRLAFRVESFWGKIGITRLFGTPITIKCEKRPGGME
ncbi:MAG TPA: class I SAM-dependent methyltransferase [bacterium]|nr:class I SAM-dependent methyltransferase [bacterium]HPN44896.1 class I SAM-dependent methyltransferase [bacterium]